MAKLIECIPNFSEGRNPAIVASIRSVIESVPGVKVLDVHMDPDHDRSVITFVADESCVVEAAVAGVAGAAELIDLNHHRGQHPRIGAADVVPLVPLADANLEDCVELAHRAGHEIFRRCQIPVYFYGAAALRQGRTLAQLRRGGFERLREAVRTDPDLQPDVGEPRLHPTAGATAVGARRALIAFNVLLDSDDLESAKRIARAVRASSGGPPGVEAMGVLLESKRRAQVSMNLTDFEETSLLQAYQAVRNEAERAGVGIAGSELVGLIPAKALEGIAPEDVGLSDLAPERILEHRLDKE